MGRGAVTPEKLLLAINGVEKALGAKIEAQGKDIHAILRQHDAELVRLTERQAQNVERIESQEREIECVHTGINAHSVQLQDLRDVPEILHGKERGKGQGMVDRFVQNELALRTMIAFWRPIVISVASALVLGAGGFVWALITHRITIQTVDLITGGR